MPALLTSTTILLLATTSARTASPIGERYIPKTDNEDLKFRNAVAVVSDTATDARISKRKKVTGRLIWIRHFGSRYFKGGGWHQLQGLFFWDEPSCQAIFRPQSSASSIQSGRRLQSRSALDPKLPDDCPAHHSVLGRTPERDGPNGIQ